MVEPMPNRRDNSTRIREIREPREIPDKLYFRIGDVARLCGVAASVLRFWETEFPLLKPNKGGTGQRLYRRRDVEIALRIKRLLYDEGYTISGARQVFKAEQKQPTPLLALGLVAEAAPAVDARKLKRLRRELEELHQMLSKPLAAPKPPRTRQAATYTAPVLGEATTPMTDTTEPQISAAAPAIDSNAPVGQPVSPSAAHPLSDDEIHRLFDDPAL